MIIKESKSKPRIMIVDDEASLRKVLKAMLQKAGYVIETAQNGQAALKQLAAAEAQAQGSFDLVICDIRMPEMSGMTLLEKLVSTYADLPVIMLTAHGTVDLAVQALKKGAFDFLSKPYEREEILMVIRKAIGQKAHLDSRLRSGNLEGSAHSLIGRSNAMAQIHQVIEKVSDTPSTVLITGESGTGKEVVAKAVHLGSSRSAKPFININCGAIPENLIESELFGYEKGAFTGAVSSKPGRFELAHEGTLFLDEIGELPTDMQVKLLRVIQDGSFERVGGIKTLKCDVRLIAATNRNLEKEIQDGNFREDLFYRLNVVPIHLPPLRDREEDIAELVDHFVRVFNQRLNKKVDKLAPGTFEILKAYNWPGNIRELENTIERTLLFTEGTVLQPGDLPTDLVARVSQKTDGSSHVSSQVQAAVDEGLEKDASMKDIVRQATVEIEKDLIARALEETQGNVTHAAKRLKISRKSLQLKMKEMGLRDKNPEEETNLTDDSKNEQDGPLTD